MLDADEFRLILSALENNKGVNVVSNPKVIVANEELANMADRKLTMVDGRIVDENGD